MRVRRAGEGEDVLARVYKIDVTICGHCGVKMQNVCAVIDGDSIRRYLKHLALDPDPPSRSLAKILQPELCFGQDFISCLPQRGRYTAGKNLYRYD